MTRAAAAVDEDAHGPWIYCQCFGAYWCTVHASFLVEYQDTGISGM